MCEWCKTRQEVWRGARIGLENGYPGEAKRGQLSPETMMQRKISYARMRKGFGERDAHKGWK